MSGRRKGRNDGEEVELWKNTQNDIKAVIADINASNDNVRQIAAIESQIAKIHKSKSPADVKRTQELLQQLDTLYRTGVKFNDATVKRMIEINESLGIVKGIQAAKEEDAKPSAGTAGRSSSFHAGPGRSSSRAGKFDKDRERAQRERESQRERERERERDREQKEKEREAERERERDRDRDRDRQQREREREREAAERDRDAEREGGDSRDKQDLYDFDGAADSPHPSPIGGHARKLGGRSAGTSSDRSGNRDSVPPYGGGSGAGAERDTPSKAGSVEPAVHGVVGSSAAMRAKVIFSEGQDVAFKPKPQQPTDTPDWYLGKVKKVQGEGKTRRYIVKDEDPDVPSPARKEYKMSASGMIPIPAPATELPRLDKGKMVLALYPDSTTFYKAEVTGMDGATGNVSLRFEGEEQSGTQQVVERRFVVDYRD